MARGRSVDDAAAGRLTAAALRVAALADVAVAAIRLAGNVLGIVRQAEFVTGNPLASLDLRAEVDSDRDAVHSVVAAAFGPDADVAELVDALRGSLAFIPSLSLVATLRGVVVGHVLLTAAELIDDDAARHRVLVLSPLSVLPQDQRRGIGAVLVREALGRADAHGEEMVVLQGSPRYYRRFGFRDSKAFGVSMDLPAWAPPEAGMAYPLSAHRPLTRGHLIESQPFSDLTHRNRSIPPA